MKSHNAQLLKQVQQVFNEPNAYLSEHIQTLWSGYGNISRFYLPHARHSIIAKVITLTHMQQHPRGWHSSFSHQRKLSSYENELRFYQELSSFCSASCRVPVLHSSEISENEIWLIMEDLDQAGFSGRYLQANIDMAEHGIKWLAHFHANFMHGKAQSSLDKVWPIGTYWHLATRPDEYQNMPNCALKTHAHHIDDALNQARFQTLLHGDAKLANFCFQAANTHSSAQVVAAVDFQYTGKGAGVKDVIYFLGSCFDSDGLFAYSDGLIDLYFTTLTAALKDTAAHVNAAAVEDEWRALVCVAWADFERFLMGWSPEHKKRHQYSHQQTQLAIESFR
ncbi:MAG: phosphotransferase [Glaciecola sp.]